MYYPDWLLHKLEETRVHELYIRPLQSASNNIEATRKRAAATGTVWLVLPFHHAVHGTQLKRAVHRINTDDHMRDTLSQALGIKDPLIKISWRNGAQPISLFLRKLSNIIACDGHVSNVTGNYAQTGRA